MYRPKLSTPSSTHGAARLHGCLAQQKATLFLASEQAGKDSKKKEGSMLKNV